MWIISVLRNFCIAFHPNFPERLSLARISAMWDFVEYLRRFFGILLVYIRSFWTSPRSCCVFIWEKFKILFYLSPCLEIFLVHVKNFPITGLLWTPHLYFESKRLKSHYIWKFPIQFFSTSPFIFLLIYNNVTFNSTRKSFFSFVFLIGSTFKRTNFYLFFSQSEFQCK